MPKIFESPDGGNTVYARESGEIYRTLVKENKELFNKMAEDKLWGEIRRMARTNTVMQEELERVIILYHLLKEEQNG
jgi:hypothetical protein